MKTQTAIVTGAAKGIGKAIAQRLIKEGYFTVIADMDKEGEKVAKDLGEENAMFVRCNVVKEDDVNHLFSEVLKKRENIHAVVNNAGIIRDNMIWRMEKEDMDVVIDVNLKGTWMMCKAAAIAMRKQSFGKIVNISSRAWLGNMGQSNYSASKAGVIGLTRVLALELGKYNVNVNAIAPGLIDTPLTQALSEEVMEKLLAKQPTRKMGKPEDIASAVAFLVSEQSTFITGQLLHIDGGRSIGSTVF